MKSAKRLTRFSMLLAAGLVLSYIESMIPLPIGIPGAKLGLSNLLVLLFLYQRELGIKSAILYSILRILLTGFLFGNLFSIVYSLCGAAFSLLIMIILKKTELLTVTGISVCGGISHNIGQLLVACILLPGFPFAYYFPFLLLVGTVAGLIIGKLSDILLKRNFFTLNWMN